MYNRKSLKAYKKDTLSAKMRQQQQSALTKTVSRLEWLSATP
jgi:hypothetical protein